MHTIFILILTISAMNQTGLGLGSPLILADLIDLPVSYLFMNDSNDEHFLTIFLGNWFNPGDAARLQVAILFTIFGGLQWFLIGAGIGALIGLTVKKVGRLKKGKEKGYGKRD